MVLALTDKQKYNFWSKVAVASINECWPWVAAQDGHGYGKWRNPLVGKSEKAYIISYKLFFEIIPPNRDLDHLCRNTICVNPFHLELVTHKENMLRGTNPLAKKARQTHCLKGHEFDEENTRLTKSGRRVCRACQRIEVNESKKKEEPEKKLHWHRRERLRQYLYDYLSQRGCMDCGERSVATLQLDHQHNKRYDMSKAIRNRIGLQRLKEELAKCHVLCANCHAKRTAIQQNWYVRLIKEEHVSSQQKRYAGTGRCAKPRRVACFARCR